MLAEKSQPVRHWAIKTLGNLLLRLVTVSTTIALGVAVSRWLGPAGRGEVSLATNAIGILIPVTTLSLYNSNPFFVAKSKENLEPLISNSLVILAILIPTVLCTMMLASYADVLATPTKSWLLAAWLICQTVQQLGFSIHLGLNRSKSTYLVEMACNLFVLAGTAIFHIREQFSFVTFLTLRVVSIALSLVYVLGSIFLISSRIFTPSWRQFVESVRFGVKSYFSQITYLCIFSLDQFLVGHYLGQAEVGLYATAVGILGFCLLIPRAAAAESYPSLVALGSWKERIVVGKELIYMTAKSTGALVILFSIAGPYLIRLLYGPKFEGAIPCLYWLLPGIWFMTIQDVVSLIIGSHSISRAFLSIGVAVLGLNILLNMIAIPQMGISGAAGASSITYLVYLGATALYLANRVRQEARATDSSTLQEG